MSAPSRAAAAQGGLPRDGGWWLTLRETTEAARPQTEAGDNALYALADLLEPLDPATAHIPDAALVDAVLPPHRPAHTTDPRRDPAPLAPQHGHHRRAPECRRAPVAPTTESERIPMTITDRRSLTDDAHPPAHPLWRHHPLDLVTP
uniref:hypothetical protein n=1 Tax=Paractinoplanes polyasparticus TaxID=2856853 RepID=UPI001C85CC73|nr:hypothetical protein [Actinoplanes polyasparticus]